MKKRKIIILIITVFVSITSMSIAETVTDANTLCLWQFDDPNTTLIRDLSGNGYNGDFITDRDYWCQGKSGKAIQFTGNNGYIRNNKLLNEGLPEGTIEFWCRFDQLKQDGTFVRKANSDTNNSENHLIIRKLKDDKIDFSSYMDGHRADLISVAEILEKQWTHIAVTWGQNGRKLYIDGILENQDTYPVKFGPGSLTDFVVGEKLYAAIDELKVSNTVKDFIPLKKVPVIDFAKADIPSYSLQGDIVDIYLYFKTELDEDVHGGFILTLVKNDKTIISKYTPFSISQWGIKNENKVGPVSFDLIDAPEGKHQLFIKPHNAVINNVPQNGLVGYIEVKGHLPAEKVRERKDW